MSFYNENNDYINIYYYELFEQYLANQFVDPEDSVLEIGARYGVVSACINKKLNNKRNHVAVEPDSRVWNALEKNKKEHGCQYQIVKGFISLKTMELVGDGVGSTSKIVSSSTIPSYSLKDIYVEKPFTMLVADCEGALESFIEDFPWLFDTLQKVMYEEDRTDICNYKKIERFLFEKGFVPVVRKFGGMQNLWRR